MEKNKPKKPYKKAIGVPRSIVKLFIRKQETIWHEEKPQAPSIFVCNHERAFGPLAMMSRFQLYKVSRPWVIGEICKAKEVPKYAREDFWCKPGRWYTKIYNATVPYVAAVILPPIMRWIGGIPVYRDARLKKTLSTSITCLQDGHNIVLFPEKPEEFGKYSEEFMTGFVMVARLFQKKTGEQVNMYPVYLDKKNKKINVGGAVCSNAETHTKEDAKQVGDALLKSMQSMKEKSNQ